MQIGNISNRSGFTLVELLTAATILSVVTTSIVAVIMKGRELQVVDKHRRQARLMIQGIMEDGFDFRRFPALANADFVPAQITIDARDGNHPLVANLITVFTPDTVAVNGSNTAVAKITITAAWREADGDVESVTLVKWLANAL
jgi:prepilin-type N-terminal cleavage/methylation domain-containing protein